MEAEMFAGANHTLADDLKKLGELESRVIHRFLHRAPMPKPFGPEFEKRMKCGERVADRVAAFGGSWKFIGLFTGAMAIWILFNTIRGQAFDPYPFILLNLLLSCLAALQAPVIMMSQNRQAARDRLDAKNDYEVNMKAEMEIVSLHMKLDELREKQWEMLLEMQRQQIALLEKICR
jgi:uncharacterized membrane protein